MIQQDISSPPLLVAVMRAPRSPRRASAPGIEAWQSADYAAAVDDLAPAGRGRRRRRPVQPRPGLSPRPRGADQPRRRQDLVRARGRTRAMSMPRPRSGCCCSRTATRRKASNGCKAAAEQGEAAGDADLRHRFVQRRHASPRIRCSATPIVSRAAAQGLAPAKETLSQLDRAAAARRPQERPRAGQGQGQGGSAAGRDGARSRRQRTPAGRSGQAGQAGGNAKSAKPSPPPASAKRPAKPARQLPPQAGIGNWRIQLGAFSQKRVGRRRCSASCRARSAGARLLYPGGRGHPAPGRSLCQPRRRPAPPAPARRARPASRSRPNRASAAIPVAPADALDPQQGVEAVMVEFGVGDLGQAPAWRDNAMPSPASSIISRSLAPSPTASTSAGASAELVAHLDQRGALGRGIDDRVADLAAQFAAGEHQGGWRWTRSKPAQSRDRLGEGQEPARHEQAGRRRRRASSATRVARAAVRPHALVEAAMRCVASSSPASSAHALAQARRRNRARPASRAR